MADDSLYILFNVIDDRSIELSLFSKKKELKKIIIEPPEQIGEALWKNLAEWFPKNSVNNLSGIAFKQDKGKGSYSTVRTILSIINTLGTVESIPVRKVSSVKNREDVIKSINSSGSQEVAANYN